MNWIVGLGWEGGIVGKLYGIWDFVKCYKRWILEFNIIFKFMYWFSNGYLGVYLCLYLFL